MTSATKIIPIRRVGGEWRCPEDVMTTLRMALYKFEPKDAAEEMGVSTGCVYAIRSGRTKWPRGSTLFALIALNGLQVRFEPLKRRAA